MTTIQSERLRVPDDVEEVNHFFYTQGWTDGLPIIPPTEDRIKRMLGGTKRSPNDIVGKVPPLWSKATIEKIAINAVMAGALPDYMPAIITALDALLEKSFNLYGVQATTHPAAPLCIFNGPMVKDLELNCGYGCFGPGRWSNATIGRTIRLVLMNIGGGVPGVMDMSTHGRAEKYTFVVAENEEANPWEPLHVERGFKKDQSCVTVLAADAPHNVQDHQNTTAAGVLTVVADTMATLGCNNLIFPSAEFFVCLGPEHAATVAREGWTKADTKRFLYEYARIPRHKAKLFGGYHSNMQWPRWMDTADDHAAIPITSDPKDVVIFVAGGGGKHSCVLPSFGLTRSVTKVISNEEEG